MDFPPTPSEPSGSDWLERFVASLTPQEQMETLADLERQWIPLPHQEPPPQPWDLWLLAGGRGSGKTDADAYYVDEHASGPACIPGPAPHRIGIIAPTHDDAKKTCVVGDSGLLGHNRDIRFTPGGKAGDLVWPNGSIGNLFGAFTPEDVERLRGPQHCLLWCEELAAWRYLEECWDQAQFGLRLGPHPHAVASSTPKPRRKFMELMSAETTALGHATTDDNPYLSERVRSELFRRYGGTRLGRQELLAEILDDMPGALVRRDQIQYGQPPKRYNDQRELVHDYNRIVVAIDPAGTYGPDSDETGIVVTGVRGEMGFVIDDLSGRFSPTQWAQRAMRAYDELKADAIVAETNYGGDMVETTLRSVGFTGRFIKVTASRGKILRAEPVTAKYEQGLIYHTRPFPELEDQLCSYTLDSKDSPDRMDALVWGFTELMLEPSYSGDQFSLIA
jgi:phage terminase large subunit-like protein